MKYILFITNNLSAYYTIRGQNYEEKKERMNEKCYEWRIRKSAPTSLAYPRTHTD